MRGIMQARTKPLNVKPGAGAGPKSEVQSFQKPAPKEAVTLAENAEQLISLLYNEAKVI